MRFMMFMIPNVKDEDWMPSAEAVAAMSKYNEALTKAGMLLSLDGLHPPSKGARVSFTGGKPKKFRKSATSCGLMSVSPTIAMVCPVPSIGGVAFHNGATL